HVGELRFAFDEIVGRNKREQLSRPIPTRLRCPLLDLQDTVAKRRIDGRDFDPVGHDASRGHAGRSASGSAAYASIAAIAALRVSARTNLRSVSVAIADVQLPGGTKKSSAPSSCAAAIFCWIPPIGPTLPVSSTVPVPATGTPP